MEDAALPIGLAVAAVVGLFVAIRSLRRRRLHVNVPTSKTKGVFAGLNEVKGVLRCADPLSSRMAQVRCVWYRWAVEEQWRRMVPRTDSKGRVTMTTQTGWQSVAHGHRSIPFELEDETGRIRVIPEGAEIEGVRTFDRTCLRSDPRYYEHGPSAAISGSTHRRRLHETALRLGVDLYVIGTARMRAGVVEPEIAESEFGEMFLISTRSEEQIVRGHFWSILLGTVLGAACAGGVGWVLAQHEGATIGAGAFLGVMAVTWLVLVYNGLVSVRERVEMANGMLDVQLRRRHVLIPRLQTCVASIAGHEKTAHERVAKLRVKGDLIALAEDYPELKTDENFRHLHDQLIDTEDRIALARGFFNNSVTAHNLRVETMPATIVAKLTGFRRRGWLQV